MTTSLLAKSRTRAHEAPDPSDRAVWVDEYRGWPQIASAETALRAAWEDLLSRDSVATFYQTPLWCLTWYRWYHDEFEPLLLTAEAGGRFVGLAPLALERATGRLVFAGGTMADYRDFVCDDERRSAIVPLFLSRMTACSPGSRLIIGHTRSESGTVDLARAWAEASGRGTIVRRHPCRTFRFGSPGELRDLYKKKTIKQAVSVYRRAGGLAFRRLRTPDEWQEVKQAFFQQHGLRQAFTGRSLAFDDPRKQALYSTLFESQSPAIHFSGLWLADRPIAFMFSFAHRGVLFYGAPSFDPLEQKQSPGIIHLLEAMKACQEEGFREVDFTMGASSFKGRLSNRCVELPTIYIYASRRDYWRDRCKMALAEGAKGLFRKLGLSEAAWDALKDRHATAQNLRQRLSLKSPSDLLRLAARRLWTAVHDTYVAEVFRMTPRDLLRVQPELKPDESCEFRQNRIEDFLTLEGPERDHLVPLIRQAVERLNNGHRLHTILINGKLAHFGWSHRPTAPVYLLETRTTLPLPQGAVSLYDYQTVEAYRGRRLYPANLSRIAQESFRNGATEAFIFCEARNRASRRGIEQVGFKRYAVHRMRQLAGMTWNQVEEPARQWRGAACAPGPGRELKGRPNT